MGTWLNSDGLYLKMGTDEGPAVTEGEYSVTGPYSVAEFQIDYSDLGTAAAIMGDTVTIPAGARVVQVQIETITAFDSAADAFVLNVGLVRQDRSTTYDADGLVAALPQASMDPAGEVILMDSTHTYKGALMGTTLAYTGIVVADYDTAAPTVGSAKVRILYRMVS